MKISRCCSTHCSNTRYNRNSSTNLRIVTVPGLIVKHVEKRFGPSVLVEVIGGRCLRLAEHVARVHQRCHVLGVAQSRNRRVPGVDRVQDSPFPVRVLVDDGEEYLGQVIAVCVPDVRAQDLVSAVTFKAGLERESIRYILWKGIQREDQKDIIDR